jgi:transcriptional regulator with XRE-family HTH domain
MVVLRNLKKIRQNYPLTVRELEAKSGVAANSISNLENLKRPARPNTIRRLAAALGVEPKELI